MKLSNINIVKSFILLVFVLGTLVSCDENRVFEDNIDVNAESWSKFDTVSFDVDIIDTISNHNIFLNLRNNGRYPYSNIFFFVNTIYPDGRFSVDTVEFLLKEASGEWKGSGFGSVWSYQELFKSNVVFPFSGKYKFKIIQGMRDENGGLPGILSSGLRIEKQINTEN